MAASRDHIERAEVNRNLADIFEADIEHHHGWSIVVRFYAALHLVDAYLSAKDKDVQNHTDRHRAIRDFPELSQGRGIGFRSTYKWLQDHSEQVRYDPGFQVLPEAVTTSKEKLERVFKFLLPKLQLGAPEVE